MSRTHIQCVHCGKDVEVFVDGKIIKVKKPDEPLFDSKKGAIVEGITRGVSRGLDEEHKYKRKSCPMCDGNLIIVIEIPSSKAEKYQTPSNANSIQDTQPNSTQDTQPMSTANDSTETSILPDETEVYDNDHESHQVDSQTIFFDIRGGKTIKRTLDPENRVTLGRNDLGQHLRGDKSEYISGRHLEFAYSVDDGVTVRDADSSNGTMLNGENISDGTVRQISHGDEFSLANNTVTFTVRLD